MPNLINSPYRHFFALPPQSLGLFSSVVLGPEIQSSPPNLSGLPCYLFIFDNDGQLACGAPSADLLGMLPCLEPSSKFNGASWLELSQVFRLFAFVSSQEQVAGCEILRQMPPPAIALCLVATAQNCGKLLAAWPRSDGLVRWQNFRSLLQNSLAWQAGLLSRAKQLAHFEKAFRFCGSCAAELQWLDAEFGKCCQDCGALVYPRQDPSIITLVCTKESGEASQSVQPTPSPKSKGREWLLLAHNNRFRPQLYSLIAGFVDAGENLEQAVRREVWEEARVEIGQPQYLHSQAWPQPHSLIAGFQADCPEGMKAIQQSQPDGIEITSLLWLERSDIRRCLRLERKCNEAQDHANRENQTEFAFPLAECRETYSYHSTSDSSGPPETAFHLPIRGSIARKLIEQWAMDNK